MSTTTHDQERVEELLERSRELIETTKRDQGERAVAARKAAVSLRKAQTLIRRAAIGN